jgi:DNA polymerase (family 10)
VAENTLPVEVVFSSKSNFGNELISQSASPKHLNTTIREKKISQLLRTESFATEQAIYDRLELPFIEPELREGSFELDLARENKLPQLLTYEELKGTVHNHSTYSDGKHTLEEMALKAKELGLEYLGISDHSKTASYANGLSEERIKEQHAEIDELNKKLAPFKILKGIESDILGDGSLDYSDEVLASFDFIVSSIHANLKMDETKATERLLGAIRNPYTSILGHPTGRLLLKREGYPIDHKTVIDACAEHNVCIEINANPLRLDLDWKWVHYALSKKVMIAINPDAHDKEKYTDMKYGVLVGRKAGLTKEMTLNAMSLAEIEGWLASRKRK